MNLCLCLTHILLELYSQKIVVKNERFGKKIRKEVGHIWEVSHRRGIQTFYALCCHNRKKKKVFGVITKLSCY